MSVPHRINKRLNISYINVWTINLTVLELDFVANNLLYFCFSISGIRTHCSTDSLSIVSHSRPNQPKAIKIDLHKIIENTPLQLCIVKKKSTRPVGIDHTPILCCSDIYLIGK